MSDSKLLLVVEDDKDICEILSSLFEDEGYKVHCYEKGLEALQAINQLKFDVIILDFHLPDTDANQIIKELEKRSYEAPVVMLSANLDKVRPHPLIKSRVPKPFDIGGLLDTVNQYA